MLADRRVTNSGKGFDGSITLLCNPGQPWSPNKKDDAVRDIERGLNSYYVAVRGHRVDVHVVTVNGSKHLRTDPDGRGKNNLDELPDC